MKTRIGIIAGVVATVLFLRYSKPSQIRRVVVTWPENATARESRSCVLAGDDPASKLPYLNCDLPAADKSWGQIIGMDVKFSTTPGRMQYVEWTCKRTHDSLICEN